MIDVILVEMHIVDEYVCCQLIFVQLEIVIVLVVIFIIRHQTVHHIDTGYAYMRWWGHTGRWQRSGWYDESATIDAVQASRNACPATLQVPTTGAKTSYQVNTKYISLISNSETNIIQALPRNNN